MSSKALFNNSTLQAAKKRTLGVQLFIIGSLGSIKLGMLAWKPMRKPAYEGTGRVAAELEAKVLELHDQHADWANIACP